MKQRIAGVQNQTETAGGSSAAVAEKPAEAVETAEARQARLDSAVASNDVKLEDDKVTAKIEGKGDVERTYRRYTAMTMAGALALAGGKIDDVLKAFNYAYDLGVRSRERQALLAANEGPEKAIEKGVKGLVAALGISEQDARKIVVDQRKALGLPV